MGHNYVGTGHIVLAILDQGEGVATQLLRNRELTLTTMKEEVRKLVG